MARICVIGAGVVGLSTALRLKEILGSAVRVTILSSEFGSATTSHAAAGSFRFDRLTKVEGYTGPRAQTVSKDVHLLSWERYNELLSRKDASEIGVVKLQGYRLCTVPYEGPFAFEQLGLPFPRMTEKQLAKLYPSINPKGVTAHYYDTVLLSTRRYMPWMLLRFKELGGFVEFRHVESFSQLFHEFDILVNCTGTGARALANDNKLTAARGQTMRVRAPHVKHFTLLMNGTERVGYVYPTPDGVVLGGVKQVDNWDRKLSVEDREHIIAQCKLIDPSIIINEETIICEDTGLRPYRDALRLEKETFTHQNQTKWVVHNYGHNDGGIGTSWGSAVIACELVETVLPKKRANL